VLIVDVRDVRELEREGRIPGSFHCPRGMLEFWIDPASPYFRTEFGEEKRVVFHCALDWRSALATQTAQKMGLENVMHLRGGFKGWKEAGGKVETVQKTA
jgi:rhodanese-related sulfurtransferase